MTFTTYLRDDIYDILHVARCLAAVLNMREYISRTCHKESTRGDTGYMY